MHNLFPKSEIFPIPQCLLDGVHELMGIVIAEYVTISLAGVFAIGLDSILQTAGLAP